MRTNREILLVYGQCVISEYELNKVKDYEGSKKGKAHANRDREKLANIRGQKKIIEWLFGGE